MPDILKELFNSSFYDERSVPEKLQPLRDKEAELWEKVLPILGMETVDALNDADGAVVDALNLHWFREGFRLGAGLMLELL